MNKKALVAIIILAGAIVSVLAGLFFIKIAEKNPQIDITSKEWDEEIYSSRTNYIGENSKVSRIVNLLKFPEELKYSGIELQTSDNAPKSLTIIFSSSNENQETTKKIKSNFNYNSMIIFSLIENCEKIELSINKNGNLYPLETRYRKWATDIVGKDPFSLSNTLEDFREYIKKIDAIDFSSIQEYSSNLEESISNAILEHNKDKLFNGEYGAQGHITFATDVDGVKTTAYVYQKYLQFQFQNGIFEECAGLTNPVLITFTKDDFGNYKLDEFKEPQDGSMYSISIQEMFPDNIIEMIKVYESTDKQKEQINNQIINSVKEYLTEIKREDAKIALGYQEKHYPILSSQNSEIFDIMYKAYADYPYYVGTKEVVSNKVRYEYKTSYEKNDNADIFTYTKTNMNTGTVEENTKLQILDGEITAMEGEINPQYFELKKQYDEDMKASEGYR